MPEEQGASLWARVAAQIVLYGLALFNCVRYSNLRLDDALIYARCIRNALDGNGLLYNPGEQINVLTSPLFTYASLLLSWPLGSALTGMMLVCSIATLANLWSYQKLFRLFAPGWLAYLGGLLMATAAITFSNFGMETALFTLFAAETLRLFLEERHRAAFVAGALLVLTRPEGVFLVAVLLVARRIESGGWGEWRDFVAPALLLGVHSVFALVYYGSLLPLSAAAKLGQGASRLWGGFVRALFDYYPAAFSAAPEHRVLVWVLLGLAALGLLHKSSRPLTRLLLPFLALYTLFFHLANVPPQAWYAGIYFSFLWFYSVVGLAMLAPRRRGWLGRRGLMLAVVLSVTVYQQVHLSGRTVGLVARDYRDAGVWIERNTPETASVAAVEIGTLGWYSRRPIIDILGLVTPGNAKLIANRDLFAWTGLYRPDYLLVHEPARELEAGAKRLEHAGLYRGVESFNVNGLRLLARQE